MTGRDGPGQCEAATSDQWDHRSDPAGAWTSAAPGRVDSLQSRSCSYVASFTPVLCCVSSPAVLQSSVRVGLMNVKFESQRSRSVPQNLNVV